MFLLVISLSLVFGCMWVFLLAFTGVTSCQLVLDIWSIESAHLSIDDLTSGQAVNSIFTDSCALS